MKITVKVGLIFALLWILIKLGFFLTGGTQSHSVTTVMVMLNILCLLLAVSIGLFLHKRSSTEPTSALDDIKAGLSAGLPYALIVSFFIFFYYSKVDPENIEHQIAEFAQGVQDKLDDPTALSDIKNSNPEFETMTKEQIYESMVESARGSISPTATMTVSMLAMLLLATLNSIFVTIVYRKLVFR